ncbi:hypothetical protein J3R82DRAFT_8943 [Butyriboletus roseoflavus]|nr:hypothetical protein J3R82DRAFT_8943 [Butyriboletus roseoflavus]
MKSVSGIQNSLTSDSVSTREGVSGSRARVQRVRNLYLWMGTALVESGDQGMGDETLIESYPFDTSSVSSHQTHISKTQHMFQGQETPRTPAFPQIQVQHTYSDAGHVPFPSSASRAPPARPFRLSPHPYSARGYTHFSHSTSPSPHSLSGASLRPAPASASLRTPPMRVCHVANASSHSDDGEYYTESPAYVSPKKREWASRKEKKGFGFWRSTSTQQTYSIRFHGRAFWREQ